jgi:hypothetical protein
MGMNNRTGTRRIRPHSESESNKYDFYGLMWCTTCVRDVWAETRRVKEVRSYILYSAFCPNCNERLIRGW